MNILFGYLPGSWKSHIQVPEDPIYKAHFFLNPPAEALLPCEIFPWWLRYYLIFTMIKNDLDMTLRAVVYFTSDDWSKVWLDGLGGLFQCKLLCDKTAVVTAVTWDREFMDKNLSHIGQPRDFYISCPKVVAALAPCIGRQETSPIMKTSLEMWKYYIFLWIFTHRNNFAFLKWVLVPSAHSYAGRHT